MSTTKLHLLSIGYAVRALDPHSREHARMLRYAERLECFHLIVFTHRRDGYTEPVRNGKLTIYPTNSRTKVGMLWAAYRIGRHIWKDAPADPTADWVISSQDPFETSCIGRMLCRQFSFARHHVQLHADVFGSRYWRASSVLNTLRYYYGRYVVRRTPFIRVVSKRSKRSLLALGVPEERITVLPIQAELESFLRVGEARVFTSDAPCRFLYVGRLAPEKNLWLLLRAFARVIQEQPTATLTILGDGPERARLVAFARDLDLADAVTFRQWSEAVPQVMAEHHVLVLTSYHEGWAMVVTEAMAAGMAVVMTDVGCAGELLNDGIEGRVVPIGDETALATAMAQFASGPCLRAEYGARAHHAAKRWSMSDAEYAEAWVHALHVSSEERLY